MADYSLLGSFSTGGASALNGELLTKLKDAEKTSVLFNIDPQLGKITGFDAETGEALETVGESDTLMVIKAQALDLMSKMSAFDLDSSSPTAFDSVSASTTGTAAVFDAVDVGGLEPGTTNITVTQLAQRDVYQSLAWTQAEMDGSFPIVSSVDLDTIKSSKLSIEVNGTTYDFNIFKDLTVTDQADLDDKTLEELAAEINQNEKLIASVEQVGTDSFKLVVKSAESGEDNTLKITQTNINIGFSSTQSSTNTIADVNVDLVGAGELNINGNLITTTGTTTYQDLADMINGIAGVTATVANGTTFDISVDDGSSLNIEQTGIDLGYSSNQVQRAQNLNANIDGIDYNVASNTVTIQGNLTMTAVEIGSSTIDIQKDTTTIVSSFESMIESYNALVDLIDAATQGADTVMNDTSTLRSMLSSIKEQLFGSYGENGDSNLFNYGLELDLEGKLSLNTTTFGEALVNNYDDVKNLFLGNTTDEDLAASDSTKYLGLGTSLQDFLDALDSSDGVITRYEANMASRLEKLQEERESTLKTLDSKYEALASQFSMYASLITQMESSFSGLNMMIEQSVASK